MQTHEGFREGPPVALVPMLTSLAHYQANPRVPFPLGYRRRPVDGCDRFIIAEIKYDREAEGG